MDKPFVVSLESFLIHVTQKLSQSKELLSIESPHITSYTDHSYDKQRLSCHAMTCLLSHLFKTGLFGTFKNVV